jgi:phenylpropionate dioxygenase-like ring-hydroxylating dioxygenase large terminal subunit
MPSAAEAFFAGEFADGSHGRVSDGSADGTFLQQKRAVQPAGPRDSLSAAVGVGVLIVVFAQPDWAAVDAIANRIAALYARHPVYVRLRTGVLRAISSGRAATRRGWRILAVRAADRCGSRLQFVSVAARGMRGVCRFVCDLRVGRFFAAGIAKIFAGVCVGMGWPDPVLHHRCTPALRDRLAAGNISGLAGKAYFFEQERWRSCVRGERFVRRRSRVREASQAARSSTAPPAEAFPEWPRGWYVIGQSQQLKRGPIGVDLWGRRLVCFRSAEGKPVVMDARCWHMGADLSAGSVVDGQIVCPFHGWRYGPSGRCEQIPSQAEIPHCAHQRSYCAAEVAGSVFAFPSSHSDYPVPFFAGTNAGELIASPPFEFVIDCPWWLVGTNGFDLQHFDGPHHRRLVGQPSIEASHPAARRIVATFEVCGEDWRDWLTRRFAGRRVTMDVTVWSGTLAFVVAHFHDSRNGDRGASGTTSYGMTEICPIASAPAWKSLARITIFRRRRRGRRYLDWIDVRIKRHFIRAFLKPDTLLLNGAKYDPNHFINADRQMIDYLQWLVIASLNESISEEPT